MTLFLQVLVDFIQCQEEITRILQYHDSLLQQTSSPATVDVTASAPAGLIGGNNRFNCLLAAVQVEHIHQVPMIVDVLTQFAAMEWHGACTLLFCAQLHIQLMCTSV